MSTTTTSFSSLKLKRKKKLCLYLILQCDFFLSFALSFVSESTANVVNKVCFCVFFAHNKIDKRMQQMHTSKTRWERNWLRWWWWFAWTILSFAQANEIKKFIHVYIREKKRDDAEDEKFVFFLSRRFIFPLCVCAVGRQWCVFIFYMQFDCNAEEWKLFSVISEIKFSMNTCSLTYAQPNFSFFRALVHAWHGHPLNSKSSNSIQLEGNRCVANALYLI